MRRQALNLIVPALILALTLSVVAVLPVTGQNTGAIIDKLKELHDELEGEKPTLQNKINAVIHQIEAGSFNGALNKLENDVKKSIRAWVEEPGDLIRLVDTIIDLIKGITPPSPQKPDFELSTLVYRLDVVQGIDNTTAITVTSINNFNKEVALTATTTASDVTLTLDPAAVTPPSNGAKTSTLKVEAATNALPGEYEVNVTGKSGSIEHSLIIPLKIIEATTPPPAKDFTITASPTALAIQQGRSNTSIIAVTSVNGFDKQVNLSVTSAPITGVDAGLNPIRVFPKADTYAISVLTVDVAADATLGTHQLTVAGESGALKHSLNITLTVTKPPVPPTPDFSINTVPASLTIEQGDTATSTIIVTSLRGFTGTVALTLAPESIEGVTLNLDPSQVTLSADDFEASELRIEVAKNTLPDEHEITITATSGTAQHSASISLTIVLEKKPPRIVSVLRLPEDAPAYNQTVTVSANVVDFESGVKDVVLSYSTNTVQQHIKMTLSQGLYQAIILASSFNTAVDYRVSASDNADNIAVSQTHSYIVTDPYPPVVGTPTWSPIEPVTYEDIRVNATVVEPQAASGIEEVILHYSNSTTDASIAMTLDHGNWTAVISSQTDPKVEFYVEAIDQAGNSVKTEAQEIAITTAAFPLAWILAAIAILAAATGGGTYYVRRRRKKGANAQVPSAAVEPILPLR